jgi:tRNA dimethylallyltransferase
LVDPEVGFSAADFVAAADKAIADTVRRGKYPILSGGTAFYHRALLEGLFEGPGADLDIRQELEEQARRDGVAALHAELARLDPVAAGKIAPSDLRRLVRALEVIRLTGEPLSHRQRQWQGFHPSEPSLSLVARYPFAMVWLKRERDTIRSRVQRRVEGMLAQGLREEAQGVYQRREHLSRVPLQAVGYKEFFPYFAGEASWAEVVERLVLNTNRLVRSQETWFRKFPARALSAGEGEGSLAVLARELASDVFAP